MPGMMFNRYDEDNGEREYAGKMCFRDLSLRQPIGLGFPWLEDLKHIFKQKQKKRNNCKVARKGANAEEEEKVGMTRAELYNNNKL